MYQELIGKKINKLTVIGVPYKKWIRQDDRQQRWFIECKCDCGNIVDIRVEGLVRKPPKQTISCGCERLKRCLDKVKTHGMSKRHNKEYATYSSWQHMKDRCLNPKHKHYDWYGGRGITVCDKWLKFDNFLSDMGIAPKGYSVERIDNNGNYCKENCRWSSWRDQMNNTRRNKFLTYNNKTQTIAQWSRELGITYSTLSGRIKRHWTIERALTTQ